MYGQSIVISLESIKKALTTLINDYIKIEFDPQLTQYEKQMKASFIRGQIAILISILNEEQQDKPANQFYYRYLVEIVQKYNLNVEIGLLLRHLKVKIKMRK